MRNNYLNLLLRTLLAAILGLFWLSLFAQEETATQLLSGRARELIENLRLRAYEAATKDFDETMKKAASPEFLKKIWEGMQAQFGPLKEAKGSRVERTATYDFVFIHCQFEKQALDARIVFDKTGKISGLNFVSHLEVKEAPPPPYAKRELFEEREVKITTGPWTLPGTLTIPKGEGPFPAVVLVHGSGPNDRDETIGPNKPFRDIAWGLATGGIAVLRYDKRTRVYREKLAHDKKLAASFTVNEETVDDAISAAALLRQTEKIDPARIFVLGHSLGGMMIPRIRGQDKNIAGFIIMAGLTRPIEQAILEQTRYIFSLQGPLTEEGKQKLTELEDQVAKIRALKEQGENQEEAILGAYPAYWLDLRNYSPTEEARKIDRPLLILQGKRDYQVTEKDFNNLKQALEGKRNVTFKLYPACNHLFIEGKGLITPNEYLYTAGNVSSEVIEDIALWVKSIK